MDIFFLSLFIFLVAKSIIGKGANSLLSPKDENNSDANYKSSETFVDNSVHNHFHVHTSEKSTEIEQLGRYVDKLQEETKEG